MYDVCVWVCVCLCVGAYACLKVCDYLYQILNFSQLLEMYLIWKKLLIKIRQP